MFCGESLRKIDAKDVAPFPERGGPRNSERQDSQCHGFFGKYYSELRCYHVESKRKFLGNASACLSPQGTCLLIFWSRTWLIRKKRPLAVSVVLEMPSPPGFKELSKKKRHFVTKGITNKAEAGNS